MKKGEIHSGQVLRVDFPNKGIVFVDEQTEERLVTVKNVLPGQRISFLLTKLRKGKGEGRLLEILEPSPREQKGLACEHFGICGGCTFSSIPIEEQLQLKQEQVLRLLKPVCAPYVDIEQEIFEGVQASPKAEGYRNKMELSFGDEVIGGELSLGMHKRGSFHDIVNVNDCRIMDEDFRKIRECVRDYFRKRKIPYYHKMRHEGYLRHLLLRKGEKTKEILIDLITTTQTNVLIGCEKAARKGMVQESERTKEQEGVEAEREARNDVISEFKMTRVQDGLEAEKELLSGMVQALCSLSLEADIVGILHTKNDSLADAVINQGTSVLYGQEYFFEELLGLRFQITAFSFFQTNSLGAELLYETVREYVTQKPASKNDEVKSLDKTVPENMTQEPASKNDEVKLFDEMVPEKIIQKPTLKAKEFSVIFDLYSGTGTIAQILAPVAKRVLGVEIVPEAVVAAKENAAINDLHNCEFLEGDVFRILQQVEETPDFIVLDPPREGIHKKALEKLIAYGVESMVYVSCKPTSLARDLEVLLAAGYLPKRICCVDLFPRSANVETVCLLSHMK
ncbi:putative RNA methyltransferase [Clostridia bacterium]|nr:putative RNA methyltransferase [Clostridia bacterium]